MTILARVYRPVAAVLATDDPRLGIANTVVLAVVGNQPFYPLYVWFIVGGQAWTALLTWASTPFFAAVPWVGRRAPLAGKLLLLAAGIGNTALCTAALGRATGVELFVLPCLALGIVLFEPGQRAWGLLASAGPIAVLLLLGGTAPDRFGPAENASLLRLHAVSVACLLVLIAYVSIRAARTRRAA